MKAQGSIAKKATPLTTSSELTRLPSRGFAVQAKGARSAVGHSLQNTSLVIQPKLTIGEPNDRYEQEADRVAAQVVQRINGPQSVESGPIQRELISGEGLQMKPMLQLREAVGGGDASADLESSINRARSGGQALDAGLQRSMGQAMGADFSRVRVHTDGESDRLNQSIQAKAFTTGQDVFFRQGAYNPGSRGGQELIAHELTHVVQQKGRAKTVQRLLTSAELSSEDKAGEAKKDRKFGFGKLSYKKKMSGLYKSVLVALDSYHSYNPSVIESTKQDRENQAHNLKSLLGAIMEASQEYLTAHPDLGNNLRSQHIRDLFTSSEFEVQAVKDIERNPPRSKITWKNLLVHAVRVKQLSDSKAFTDKQFHGSGSGLLDKIDGRLMSGAALQKEGKVRNTGEGDFFSSFREGEEEIGEKNFISTGQSLPGMGTAYSYAIAAATDENYNTAIYTDEELNDELHKLDIIIENYDESLNKVAHDDKMGARKNIGQFKSLKNRLEGERQMRASLPLEHARRRGEKYSESTFGLLLEFSSQDLTVVNPRAEKKEAEEARLRENSKRREGEREKESPTITMRMDEESPRALGGERMIMNESIDLRGPGRLLRVYCPFENMTAVREKVFGIVGHREFELIPFEALIGMPDAMDHTQQSTLEAFETIYRKGRKMVLEAYSHEMGSKKIVDNEALEEACKRLGWK
jgi:hypothetical protein